MCIGSTSILCARRVGVADVGSGEAGGVSPLCGRWVGGADWQWLWRASRSGVWVV